jgi:hypothetical protein
MRKACCLLLALCAATASAQLQKVGVAEKPIPPFERTEVARLAAASDGVYLVTANVTLTLGWYGYPVILEVQSSAPGNLVVCSSTAPFASAGPGPIPAMASCSGLVALRSGDLLSAAVYHESGAEVVSEGQRSTFAMIRLNTAVVRRVVNEK